MYTNKNLHNQNKKKADSLAGGGALLPAAKLV
jgi:hypothetical protein